LSEIASVATLPRNDTFVNHFLIKISNLNLYYFGLRPEIHNSFHTGFQLSLE